MSSPSTSYLSSRAGKTRTRRICSMLVQRRVRPTPRFACPSWPHLTVYLLGGWSSAQLRLPMLWTNTRWREVCSWGLHVVRYVGTCTNAGINSNLLLILCSLAHVCTSCGCCYNDCGAMGRCSRCTPCPPCTSCWHAPHGSSCSSDVH